MIESKLKGKNCNRGQLFQGGREGGALIPFPRKSFFSNPSSNPTIPACVAQIEIPFPFFYCFSMNPSPSAQNPISQPLKKANPSSHFTPSRPSLKRETDWSPQPLVYFLPYEREQGVQSQMYSRNNSDLVALAACREKETSQILLQTLWHLRKPKINLVSLWRD